MKNQIKPMKNWEEFVEVFGNPEEVKKRIAQFKAVVEELNKKLDIIGKWDEVESSHANVKAIEANAQAQYRLAEEAKGKARIEAEKMVQKALADVKSIQEDLIQREKFASSHDFELRDRERSVEEQIEKSQAALKQAKELEAKVSGSLTTELAAAKTLTAELNQKLAKVNVLLAS